MVLGLREAGKTERQVHNTMRDNYIPEDLLIVSEELEPAFCRVIGKFFAQCEHLRKTHSTDCVFFVDTCDSWWWTMNAMNSMTIGISSAIHAGIAIGNEMRRVSDYIEKHLGFNPVLERENLKDKTFRHLAKGVDTDCIFDKTLHLTTP